MQDDEIGTSRNGRCTYHERRGAPCDGGACGVLCPQRDQRRPRLRLNSNISSWMAIAKGDGCNLTAADVVAFVSLVVVLVVLDVLRGGFSLLSLSSVWDMVGQLYTARRTGDTHRGRRGDPCGGGACGA